MSEICQQDGCAEKNTTKYTLHFIDDENPTTIYLCWQHTTTWGFCPWCGFFVNGSGDERTFEQYGVCAVCVPEVVAETVPDDSDYWE